jgi:CheY-like chemotaxis protein
VAVCLLCGGTSISPDADPGPRAARRKGSPPRDAPLSRSARRERVLVIEVEAPIRTLLELALRSAGFDVLTVATAEEGVEIHRRQPRAISLVVLDAWQHGPDGRHALGAVRAIDPEVRCCLLTDDPDLLHDAGPCAAGAVLALRKPFTQRPPGPRREPSRSSSPRRGLPHQYISDALARF